MRLLMTLACAAVVAAPLAAQAPDSTADAMRRRLDALLRIPQRVEDLRRAGVPDTAVRGVLEVLKGAKVDPEQSEAVLASQAESAREHGPTDNFGAFVQARLASGLRGKELADAIRAEHRAKGKGKPATAGEAGHAPDDHAAKGKAADATGAKGRAPDAGARGKTPDAAGTKGKAPGASAAPGKAPESAGAKGKAPDSRRPPR
jgi:hypothetical protein